MKITKEKQNTKTAQRTIQAFSNAIIELLQKNALEQITITMLCEKSTYPRSTFYNYFEDIYDLIDYLMEKLSDEIEVADFKDIDHKVRSLTLFQRSYDVLSRYNQLIKRIVKKNDCNGVFMQRVRRFMKKTISYIIANSECMEKFHVSNEIMQQHYSNTFLLLLEQCFLTTEPITKDEAVKALDFLLGTLERESIRN